MALKLYKENEHRVQEELYNNVYLLTLIYPTNPEFDYVFKKDMFLKNNKAGFHQVIYYLLHILNPDLIKTKLTCWPIIEIRMESQFRSELIKYINELNTIYPHANIPTIMTSHLISPGGYKFTNFMFKISQLVLFEHLQTTLQPPLLSHMKPLKNKLVNQRNVRHLTTLSAVVERDCRNIRDEFFETLRVYKVESVRIQEELVRLNIYIPELTNRLTEFNEKNVEVDLEDLDKKILEIEKGVNEISQIKNNVALIKSLSNSILHNYLEHQPGDFEAPKEISHIINHNSKLLNLCNLFEGFVLFMEKKSFENISLDLNDINENYNKYTILNQDLKKQLNKIIYLRDKFNSLMGLLKDIVVVKDVSIKKCTNSELSLDLKDSLDSVLAVPLIDSPPLELC